MTGNVQYSGNHKYFQYRCANRCGNKSISAEPLENSIFRMLGQCLFSEPNQQAIVDTLNENAKAQKQDNDTAYQQLRAKASRVETAQNNLLKVMESGKATHVIMNRLEILDNESEQIQTKIANLDRTVRTFTSDDLSKLQNSFTAYLQKSDTINNKRLLNSTISRIDVGKNEVQVTLAEGIPVDRQTKNLFIKEKNIMPMKNNIKKVTIEGILLDVNHNDKDILTLNFVMRDKMKVGYTENSIINVSIDDFYGIAEEAECDIIDMVGSKFEMIFEIVDNEITNILELTKVA